ncbi:SDR family oxidoreductase [Candidatus Pelagibacter sp. HIMB1517]|uniref:SDR family oxidoreductase n=1 Tax=Candidatus Pelagibacter sp. HIMB1517 TaxID=3413341 RepID=UPI003F84B5E9
MEIQNKIFDMSDNFCLVTGACGLLGKQHAIALLEMNSNVILVDINKSKGLKIIKELKKNYSNKIFYFNCDVTNIPHIKKLKKEINKKKIYINVLINNAALNPQPKDREKKNNWQKSIDIGLTGAKNMIEIFAQDLNKNKSGNIINIGSDLSVIAPDQTIYKSKKNYKPVSYSVVKHGIVGLTKYYASLLASKNIRCNCLSPGGVYNKQDSKFVKKLISKIPLNRMASKDEYIGAIQFLASSASKYMTGHNLIIDGGRSII